MTDLLVTGVALPTRRRRVAAVLFVIAALVVVMAPALWNGFPLMFPDTGGYLERAFQRDLELGRSALYGVFLAAGIPTLFWVNIFAQCTLVVWLLALTLRACGLGGRPWLLFAVTAALSVVTGMAWYAAMLMPDILLPSAVLALYLLAFHRTGLGKLETLGLLAVVAFAVASHMGTLAACLALTAGIIALRLLPQRFPSNLPRPQLALPSWAVAGGAALALLSNLVIAGELKFTPGGDSFLFGRLVQDGIVARYLEDRCPDPTIELCPYRNRMPTMADDWLWAPGNILGELGGWDGFAKEQRRIVIETVKLYPFMHIVEAAKSSAEQIAKMKTEVSLVADWMAPAIGSLKELVPQITPTMMAARQQAQPFPQLIEGLNTVHVPVAALSLLALAGLVIASAFRPVLTPSTLALSVVVLIAIFANAAICGTFSNPVDRYESRIIWLAPLALMLAAMTFRRARKT